MAQPVNTKEQSSISLNEEFFTLWKDFNQCMDNISSPDVQFKTCIESCYLLKKRVALANMFSSNEDIDDVNTNALKFGLLPFFLSELYTNRNEGKRTRSLRFSDEFGKILINHCDRWTLLSKAHRDIFERGTTEKLNAFQARTEMVDNLKLQKHIESQIDAMLKRNARHKQRNADTKWRLFTDDEDERTFWLNQFQIAILKTLKTLKLV